MFGSPSDDETYGVARECGCLASASPFYGKVNGKNHKYEFYRF
jgi:hypothetical protein